MALETFQVTSCRVRNAHAALGALVAYTTPVKIKLDGLVLGVQGGNLRMSGIKAIERITTYEYLKYMLTLDNNDCTWAEDAILIGNIP